MLLSITWVNLYRYALGAPLTKMLATGGGRVAAKRDEREAKKKKKSAARS